MAKIKRALLSCYDKNGVVELAQLLKEYGVEIISTSGTLEVLRKAGIEAQSMEDYTGVPEMMDGRVKSLHPKVHAGLLGIRDSKLHCEQMQAYEMEWIDLVAVNAAPLDEVTVDSSSATEEVLQKTDIGGVAMVRSAAKNFRYVTVVVNPQRYPTIMHELRAHDGEVSFALRYKLAQEAFTWTAAYDNNVAELLQSQEPTEE